jgi:hypothetical protein
MTEYYGTSKYARVSSGFSKLSVLICLLILTGAPGFSKDKTEDDDGFIVDTSSIGKIDNGYVRSEQFLELGDPTSGALSLEGEKTLKSGNLDRAIMVLQRSVEMAPMDMDARVLYAEALEKKISKQKDKDPHLFNFLIKQWLYVFKQAEFYDQSMQGLSHLVSLTGSQPKRFENEKKFLARVLIPEDGSVKVALKSVEADGRKIKDDKDDNKDKD